MTIMKEIREAVDSLDLAGANEEFREDVQEIAEAQHLGLRALSMLLMGKANNADLMADSALKEFQGIVPGDNQPPGFFVTGPVYVQTHRQGSGISVTLMDGAVDSAGFTLAEHFYDIGTDALGRFGIPNDA